MRMNRGSAYIFVLIAAALLLMMVSAALYVTSSSRLITARYPAYANLYDLAAAGNERVLFLLRDEFEKHKNEIHDEIGELILAEDIIPHIVHRGGQFYLAHPQNKYFAELYISRADEIMDSFIRNNFSLTGGAYCLSWDIEVDITTGETIHEIYRLKTEISAGGGAYMLRTEVSKSLNGAESWPAVAEAELIWPDIPYEEYLLRAGNGDITDMEALREYLAFDTEAENGAARDIAINNFDDITPAMVKSKKIAN